MSWKLFFQLLAGTLLFAAEFVLIKGFVELGQPVDKYIAWATVLAGDAFIAICLASYVSTNADDHSD